MVYHPYSAEASIGVWGTVDSLFSRMFFVYKQGLGQTDCTMVLLFGRLGFFWNVGDN